MLLALSDAELKRHLLTHWQLPTFDTVEFSGKYSPHPEGKFGWFNDLIGIQPGRLDLPFGQLALRSLFYPNNKDSQGQLLEAGRRYRFKVQLSKPDKRRAPFDLVARNPQLLPDNSDQAGSQLSHSTEAARRLEVEQIFNENSQGSVAALRNSARAIYGVQGDMYWAVDRFVFELLQNADDLPATPGGSVRVQIRLLPNYLVFQHTGLPFRYQHVLALANVGQSTKTADASTTGYKGIGFKSVYSKSPCVYVRSGGYSFRFASDGNDDVPWQTWPRWTEIADYPPELRADADFFSENKFPVSFGLQIRPGDRADYAEVLRKLFQDPRFALFLRSLDEIRVLGDDLPEICLTRTRQPATGLVTFQALGQETNYLRHTYPVTIGSQFKPADDANPDDAPQPKLPTKLEGVNAVTIQFAAPYDVATNALLPMDPSEAVLSAYLPTTDTSYGLALLVNADFTLISSREKVTLNNAWNEFLFRQIGRLLVQWVADRISEDVTRASNLYQFLPLAQASNANQQALTSGLEEGIATIACLPPADPGPLQLFSQAVLDEVGLFSILPTLYHSCLTDGLTVVHPLAAVGLRSTDILDRINLAYIDLAELQGVFQQTNITAYYTPADAARLLSHLAAQDPAEAARWQKVPWVFDQHSQLTAPNALAFYGVLSERWEPDFPLADQVRYLHPILQKVIRSNPAVQLWVGDELGLAPYTRAAIVCDLLIPAACNPSTDQALSDKCIQYLYHLHRRQELQKWLTDTERKKLSALDVLCDDGHYHKLSQCYLSRCYQPPFELEVIAEEIGKTQFPLVSKTYLAEYAEPAGWREFWIYGGIPTPNAADLLKTKLLPEGVNVTQWSAAKHEAVLRLALDAYCKGQVFPHKDLGKLRANTLAAPTPLAQCVLPLAHNPHLALLAQLPLPLTPATTLAASYFIDFETEAVANLCQAAGCKPWSEADTLTYICTTLAAATYSLSQSVAVVHQLFKWNEEGKLTTSQLAILAKLPLFQQDDSVRPAATSYFSSAYGPEHDIEKLSAGQQRKLLSEAYLPAGATESERDAWFNFFARLGVAGKFQISEHPPLSRSAVEKAFPEYLVWADDNPLICPSPYNAKSFQYQHSLQNFISINNLDLVNDTVTACFVAGIIASEAERLKLVTKPAPIYHTTYGNLAWPAGSLLCAFSVVPCSGTSNLQPAHKVYSKHLGVVPPGAPVATVTYGSIEVEGRLGLRTSLNTEDALELLAAATATYQAGAPLSPESRINFTKTLAQVLPWLTGSTKVAPAWRSKLLLPAANDTWASPTTLHQVSRRALYLKTSGAIVQDLAPTVSGQDSQKLAELLSIPLLTDKEFILAPTPPGTAINFTAQVRQRLQEHQLFPLLCEYTGRPAVQATNWNTALQNLAFQQLPLLQRQCTVIPNYRIDHEERHRVQDKTYYFVGPLWSACHWQPLANFLVQQLELHVPTHVIIRLLETRDHEAQADVFIQAERPIPIILQSAAPLAEPATKTVVPPVVPKLPLPIISTPFNPFPVKDIPAADIIVTKLASTSLIAPSIVLSNKIPDAETEKRTDIGKWCEELIYKYLLKKSADYSEIEWPNQHQESGKPYDFKVRQHGVTRYIEVKGTPSQQKDIVYLSRAEWQLMFQQKEQYSLFRVYGAGQEHAYRIEEIENPGTKILNGELAPNSIELQL